MLAVPECDTIEVSRLAWDMKEWELHYLRRLVSNLLVDDLVAARTARRRRQEYLAACQRALRDEDFRRLTRTSDEAALVRS